jgi:hypothetical protein
MLASKNYRPGSRRGEIAIAAKLGEVSLATAETWLRKGEFIPRLISHHVEKHGWILIKPEQTIKKPKS